MKRIVNKEAIRLESGDKCVGPALLGDRGVVKSTVVVDKGVQINWEGGFHTTRPEDYKLEVLFDDGAPAV